MRIAINAADLDHSKIDGTRIYIQNLLKNFGRLDKRDRFLIYHKKKFNPHLRFPLYENYEIIKKPFPFWWTQTKFSREIWREKPDVLWMPMHSLPFFRPSTTRTVVTIHDLAFKLFPEHFPKNDLRRLNLFTAFAVRNTDRIIAISNSTKNDILTFYPKTDEAKIRVIYHGYDKNLFRENITENESIRVQKKFGIKFEKYLIHVGVVRPRKNIETLLKAYDILRRNIEYRDLGLVIAGRFDYEILDRKFTKDKGIIITGMYDTKDLPALLAGAQALVFPSLYEGFGIPALEAMACGTPVVAAANSSLSEIVGESGILFESMNIKALVRSLRNIIDNDKIKTDLRKKGIKRARSFSWEKCSQETLEVLRNWP